MRSLSVSIHSSLLSLAAITAGVSAQNTGPGGEIISVPGTETQVRLHTEDARPAASVSRDGGQTWRPLARPDNRLVLRYRQFDPLAGEPTIAPAMLADVSNELFIVQFATQIIAEYRDGLRAEGAQVQKYLPNQAYVVRMDRSAVESVRDLDFVRWVGPLHPAYKLDPELIEDIVSGSLQHTAKYNVVIANKHQDTAILESTIREIGGVVDMPGDGGLLIEATLSPAQMMQLVNENTVAWIDRWSAPEYDMDNARIQSGANAVETLAGINGQGMAMHINEGINVNHQEFQARPPHRTAPINVMNGGSSSHGTSTAGEVFAIGINPSSKGILPFAQGYYTNSTSSRYTLYTNLNNLECFSSTASWGGSRTANYTSTSAAMDDAIFDHDIFVTNSQSNAGNTQSRPEAWAKNICSVGGFSHGNNSTANDDCWCGTGSTGPAADGRIGVTLTGYYDSINTTSGSSGNQYTGSFGGTSGATPMVNGMGGATIEMFTDGLFGYPAAPGWQNRWGFRPHFTTTKALLAATSRQLTWNNANRYQQGWGFPNLADMYTERNRMLVLDEEDRLTQGTNAIYYVYVPVGTNEFRASMQYSDPAASPSAGIHRINSLDLVVLDYSEGGLSNVFWGNDGLVNAGTQSRPSSHPNSSGANDRDTEECVILNNPAPGVYAVVVRATAIREDAVPETPSVDDADFSLVVRGITGGRDTSGLLLDLTSTAPGDFDVSLSNVPAFGWAGGHTMFTYSPTRPVGMGNVFGIDFSTTAQGALAMPRIAGDVNHFVNTSNQSLYPNATYEFATGAALALQGVTVDAQVFLYNAAGSIVAVSNVDRVVVQ